MKNHLFLSVLFATALFCQPTLISAQKSNDGIKSESASQFTFKEYFTDKTLRIDYLLAGDASSEIVYFSGMREEPQWGGPHNNLIDPFGYGTYRYMAYDSASGKLIFSRGYSSLFQEWKGTPEAKIMKRAFSMVAVMPFPQRTIRFVIEKRNYNSNQFESIFERIIAPTDYFITKENIHRYPVTEIYHSGDPANHVDIAFLAEGYTTLEMDKFRNDARSMFDYFMTVPPYNGMKDRFNFYAIEAPSDESGVTIPGKDIYVNTNIHSSFYTFDMDRYLTTSDTRAVYDIAASAPYDIAFVLVNSKRYGGGGFYNHYGQSTVDNNLSKIVAIHEFGHTFAGLADEYYTSEVTYSDFYNLKFEPWEPNITTRVNFDLKWKDKVDAETPIPTPREDKYKNTVGLFEGGGYLSKGIYSPMMDCRMKSNEAPGFCPACQEAIRRMILFYCDKETTSGH